MSYEIQNTLRGKSLIRVVGADTVSLNMNAFSTNTSSDVISTVKLTHIVWSTNDTITIARNSNAVLSLYNSGDWNLQSYGWVLSNTATGNVDITITGGGTCLLECTKEATYNPKLG